MTAMRVSKKEDLAVPATTTTATIGAANFIHNFRFNVRTIDTSSSWVLILSRHILQSSTYMKLPQYIVL
jgi:hypothetical protein